jgi:hypothetical protein
VKKNRIATYINPVSGVDSNALDHRLRLHTRDCRYLLPNTNRPHAGHRKATKYEKANRLKCKVCG